MNNSIYIIDIVENEGSIDDCNDASLLLIINNRDLIRGYTCSYYTASEYYRFLTNVIGKYVDIVFISEEIPNNLPPNTIPTYAYNIHQHYQNKFKGLFGAATLPRLVIEELYNGDIFICNETMRNMESIVPQRNFIITMMSLLNNPVLKYVNDIKCEGLKCLIEEFTQLIFGIYDGLVSVSKDAIMDFGYMDDCKKLDERECRFGIDNLTYLKYFIVRTKFTRREL